MVDFGQLTLTVVDYIINNMYNTFFCYSIQCSLESDKVPIFALVQHHEYWKLSRLVEFINRVCGIGTQVGISELY